MTMKMGGIQRSTSRGRIISLGIVAVAALFAILATGFYDRHPNTDDASIDADVVHVAPAVAGRVIEIAVSENARVKKGDLLFQIAPLPYRLAVDQTEADLKIAEAQLETQKRILSTQRSTATIAAAKPIRWPDMKEGCLRS
jgi:multidrug efflux system membrane fusion protein